MKLTDKSRWTRRHFLRTAAIGTGGLTAFTVLGSQGNVHYLRESKQGAAVLTRPFSADWLFGEAARGSNRSRFEDSHFEKINLPHSVADLSWRKWDPDSWEKTWCYRRHFTGGNALAGKRTFLKIGAAMTAATVTLNDNEIGKHVGGYLPFDFELTQALVPGENVLAVELDARFDINVPPNKPGHKNTSVDFWQPGGLYRSAKLHVVPQTFISDVFAKPLHVLREDCGLAITCIVDTSVIPNAKVAVKAELYDEKTMVAEAAAPVAITADGPTPVHLSLTNLKNVHLWDIDNPYLYQVKSTLLIDEKPVHDYMVRTGFRDARFTKEGFLLNGNRIQLFGVNRHQFYPFAGGAVPDRVQRKDVEILRHELNCNMVRCSHYPQSESFFDACDELGLMSWEEAAGWGRPLGNEQWKQRAIRAVGDMVRRDRNHPSIVVWGARLNETPDDLELYRRTKILAYKLDGSRQTTGAMIGGLHDTENFVQDVFSYNDYKKSKGDDGRWQPELLSPRTDLPYFVSEAVGTLSGPAKYYRRTDDAILQQGQALAHGRVHNIAGSDKRYCGLLSWSGYDYPSGSGNQFEGVKYTGVVDLFRVPKLGAAIYQSQVNPLKKPVIALAFYWHFGPKSLPFKQGEQAMICSNCDKLVLFVDGKHHVTVRPDKERFPHLTYPPFFVDFKDVDGTTRPELRIDGYVSKQKMVTQSYCTDEDADCLLVAPDDKQLHADGSDATRVMFRVVDKYGMPRPYAKGNIIFTLKGPAVLVGENPFAFEDTGGVGAVWIRTRPGQRGEITLEVKHPILGSEKVYIEAV